MGPVPVPPPPSSFLSSFVFCFVGEIKGRGEILHFECSALMEEGTEQVKDGKACDRVGGSGKPCPSGLKLETGSKLL